MHPAGGADRDDVGLGLVQEVAEGVVSRGVGGDEVLLLAMRVRIAGADEFEIVGELLDGTEVVAGDSPATDDTNADSAIENRG